MHEFKSLSAIVKNREAFADDIKQDQTAQNMQTGLRSLSSARLVKSNIIKFCLSFSRVLAFSAFLILLSIIRLISSPELC